MGCVGAKDQPDSSDNLSAKDQAAHRQIKDTLLVDEEKAKREKKILLLGSGSSGKSTIFRQLKCLYKSGLEPLDHDEARQRNRQNMVKDMLKLLLNSERLHEKGVVTQSVDVKDSDILAAIHCVSEFREEQFEIPDSRMEDPDLLRLGAAIDKLWRLPAIQETFAKGRSYFAISENIEFFFNKATQVFDPNYSPSEKEVLLSRCMTTGVIDGRFNMNGTDFLVYDAGGQHSERRKWIVNFSGVTAILFVAALNHYNRVLFENETKNAMHDSIELFKEVINMRFFKATEIILFLNKKDLFIKLLQEGVYLSACFATAQGWEDELWDGTDANPYNYQPIAEDADQDAILFQQCYDHAVDFISAVYQKQANNKAKRIYVHVTDATDRDLIENVFWDVQDIAIRANLRRGGLF